MESIPQYIAARNNPGSVEYLTPQLIPILESTHGCIVYQEQVMSIFRELAGYTLGRADIVRRAMSKKKLDVILAEKETFIKGATERGIEEDIAATVFDRIEAFANYAFNKSHSVPYAMVSYRTAYLKANYPAEFCAALLTSVLSNPAKVAEYTDDFSRYKVRLLPPDINESMSDFSVSGKDIRFGLMAIKSVGRIPAQTIIDERRRGRFTSFTDFLERMPKSMLNKRTVEALIRSGSFDSLGVYRSRLIAVYENLMEQISRERAGGLEGQMDLFSSAVGSDVGSFDVKYPSLPEYDTRTKLSFEKEFLGMYVSGHLTDDYSKHIEDISPTPIFSLVSDDAEDGQISVADGDYVNLCGVITSVTVKKTKAGADMAFFNLEDRTGDIECLVFDSVYRKFFDKIIADKVVMCRGRFSSKEDEKGKLILTSVTHLEHDNVYVPKKRVEVKANNIPSPPEERRKIEVNDKDMTDSKKQITKIYIRLESLDCAKADRVTAIADVCPGGAELILYGKKEGKYVSYSRGLLANDFIMSLLSSFLDKSDIVIKQS